jgi:hypothetical protein
MHILYSYFMHILYLPSFHQHSAALAGGPRVQYASIEVLELMPLLTNTTPGVNTYGAGVNQVLYSH